MNLTDFKRIPRLREEIQRIRDELNNICYISGIDSSSPSSGGGLPGDPTGKLALRRSLLTVRLTLAQEELEGLITEGILTIDQLPPGPGSALSAAYLDASTASLDEKILRAYRRQVSRRTYYRDLKAAEAVLHRLYVEESKPPVMY